MRSVSRGAHELRSVTLALRLLLFEFGALGVTLFTLASAARIGQTARRAGTALVTALALAQLLLVLRIASAGIKHPPMWDFWCFRLYGQAIVHGHQLYGPGALNEFAAKLPVNPLPQNFVAEVLNVGMIYPPQTSLLFAPLGLFSSLAAAAGFWYALMLISMALLTAVVARFAFRDVESGAVPAAFVIVAAFPATIGTLQTAQTLILATLFAALAVWDEHPVRSAVWITLAAIVKPLLVLLLLYWLLRRRTRAIIAALAAAAVTSAGALLLMGTRNFITYFAGNPAAREPEYLYREPGNQSLFSFLLRTTGVEHAQRALLHDPLFVGLCVALCAVSVIVCFQARSEHRAVCMSLLIALGLLIYPAASYLYGVLLLIPIGVFWANRKLLGLTETHVTVLAFTLSILIGFGATGEFAFAGFACTWLACCAVLIRHKRGAPVITVRSST